MYDLQQGPTEQIILDQARKQNLPIPDKIKNAPELLPGLAFYYLAFKQLSTCRQIGMGEGPIPWLATEAYCTRHEVEGEDYDIFVALIEAMDMEYLKYRHGTTSGKGKGQAMGPDKPARSASRKRG